MEWQTLLVGVFGALLGAGGSLGAMWIQTQAQARRDRARMGIDMAMMEFRLQLDRAEKQTGHKVVQPLPSFLHYYVGLARLIEDDNLSVKSLKRLGDERDQLVEHFMNEYREKTGNAPPQGGSEDA